MKFRASFCDPFCFEVIELGPIETNNIIEKFESTDWKEYLRKMEFADEDQIHLSPSLEIENTETKHGLCISAVGTPASYEFYVFYKRPKRTKFLGLIERMNENYTTDKTGFTRQSVLSCLNALINYDTAYLDVKIG